jgi:hypothetical protein
MKTLSRSGTVLPVDHALGIFGGAALLACFLWSPSLLGQIIKDGELRKHGLATAATVIEHRSWKRRGELQYSATASYKVGFSTYTLLLRGVGASPERLPIGSQVQITYLPESPTVAYGSSQGAESRPLFGWWHLAGLWLVSVFFFAAAWAVRRRKVNAARVTPNPSVKGTSRRRAAPYVER